MALWISSGYRFLEGRLSTPAKPLDQVRPDALFGRYLQLDAEKTLELRTGIDNKTGAHLASFSTSDIDLVMNWPNKLG